MRFRKICIFVAAALLMVGCTGCDASAPPVEESPSSTPSASATVAEETAKPTEDASTESATASASAEEPAASDEPATMPEETALPNETVSFLGNITNVDMEMSMVTVAEEKAEEPGDAASDQEAALNAIDCLIGEQTVMIDAQSGQKVGKGDLKGGMRVFAFVSPMMTRSIPPQANCYALITNIAENDTSVANYVKAMEVSTSENGDLVVLNQNADLYVTIPADLKIETLDGGEAAASDIKENSVFIAWYDMIAESFPAQTTATKVVLCPEGSSQATDASVEPA